MSENRVPEELKAELRQWLGAHAPAQIRTGGDLKQRLKSAAELAAQPGLAWLQKALAELRFGPCFAQTVVSDELHKLYLDRHGLRSTTFAKSEAAA